MKKRIFVDMDGTLAKWNTVSLDTLYEQYYYKNLEPNINLLSNIKKLIERGQDVFILSSFLNDSKYALDEKNQWLDLHLPEIKNDKRIFVKYGDNKSDYIPNGINQNDYLIDDYTKNLLEWDIAGGTGIKYLNGINHTNKTWKGLMLEDNNLENSLDAIFNNKKDNNVINYELDICDEMY